MNVGTNLYLRRNSLKWWHLENWHRSGGADSILNQKWDAILEKNCIFKMMEKMPSATGEFLRQMVCAWKGEPEMAKTSICTISCKRLTTKFLIKHTLEREQLPCCFLESYAWIFYNESEQISKGGGVRWNQNLQKKNVNWSAAASVIPEMQRSIHWNSLLK